MFDEPGAVLTLLLHASGAHAGEPIR